MLFYRMTLLQFLKSSIHWLNNPVKLILRLITYLIKISWLRHQYLRWLKISYMIQKILFLSLRIRDENTKNRFFYFFKEIDVLPSDLETPVVYRLMNFNKSCAVDRVIRLFQTKRLNENSLCICTQVWDCAGTENSVHQRTHTENMLIRFMHLFYVQETPLYLRILQVRRSLHSVQIQSRSATSDHEECAPCPDS